MNNKTNSGQQPVPKVKKLASPLCFYIAGGICLGWSLLLPLYRLSDYLLMLGCACLGWAAASRLLPKEVVEVREAPAATGDRAADSAVQEGRAYLAQLERIRGEIKAACVQTGLLSIDGTVQKILAAIQDDPRKAPMVRRLMGYYLPTLIKLADYYRKLELQGGDGENIAGSMERIEENLTVLDLALRKQLDRMYERDALDITTDIIVMENMLAREGLAGGMPDMQAGETMPEGITLPPHDQADA